MVQKHLDEVAIIGIAQKFLAENYPDAWVDLNDLAGACLFYQQVEHKR